MAQKQFKIGLSNTDKQNMAQDVYERLLALTFPEYDTTTEYEVGDFVVYNDQLYKCISATSGDWDSTKWQLATLNDLVTDIEDAVAFVNDKANVNGNYPTMTVGFADNLTPYDESAGDDQDEPFILQATGTGNGTQPDFSTGSGALMKEKQGNTVVVNQLVNAFSGVGGNGLTATYSDGVLTVTGTVEADETNYFTCFEPTKLIIKDHKYLFVNFKSIFGKNVAFQMTSSPWSSVFSNISSDYAIKTALVDAVAPIAFVLLTQGDVIDSKTRPLSIDLTQWFNGDIPQDLLDNPANFFRYYNGSLAYNEGTLVNANGRYIKCIGMNQWDEVAEPGSINSDGSNQSNLTYLRSKNYIPVISNATYYFKCPDVTYFVVHYYDADKKHIDLVAAKNQTRTTPSNCAYIRFYLGNDNYGTTYNHDISINLYYEDEPRCLTYEPYQVLTNNDTGTEVLRSAGNAKDSKAPDGTVHRRIGSYTFTGNEAYSSGTYGRVYVSGITSVVKIPAIRSNKANILFSNFIAIDDAHLETNDRQISISENGSVGFCLVKGTSTDMGDVDALKAEIVGKTIYFELAEPTTEQGTPYSENLVIDDFGSMDFDSDVPQGCLIFYPVDYKAFVDTLYKYTDGTPSNIALKSDVASEQSARESVDSQLKNALGGTLRQCLCVKETLDFDNTDFVDLGNLDWSLTSANYYRSTSLQSIIKPAPSNSSVAKILCTLVKTNAVNNLNSTVREIGVDTSGRVCLYPLTTYTDATTFKNAMKGVLLAYEKASEQL